MKTRSKPFERVQRLLGRIEGVRIDALPLQRGQHARPLFSDTSRSADVPPNSTATFPKPLIALTPATSLPGTAPIEPAPMVITTSPSRATSRIACGMAAMSSTNTGSTLPATRIARASVRPSAATIGASPAA